MMRETEQTVLFADVSGSTQIYDTLGDVRARAIVARCVGQMTEATVRNGGTVIKTIGDEVMTAFPAADAAANAACDMQDVIAGQMVDGRPLAIRVGFHAGRVLLEGGDVFGDAVNVAARMAAQAKPGQILTTAATVAALSGPRRASCRQIDLTRVRGKSEDVAIFELVWKAQDVTVMRAPWATREREAGSLTLVYGGTRLTLGDGQASLTIGRSDQNDIVVNQPVVSRLHARIEYRNGRFALADLSANGTFVAPADGQARYIHRDNLELTGSGLLGLGEAPRPDSLVTVRYEPG